ncbi:MAG: hypothetical protein ACRDLT_16405 [Solirubrobacteraceae bacterium]
MSFQLRWTSEAATTFSHLQQAAEQSSRSRADPASKAKGRSRTKSSKQEGLFKQVAKAVQFLQENPRHPGLRTHEYTTLEHPYEPNGKVFEAYAQNRTPGAYRIFWCYGPEKGQITVIAITPHP